MKLQPVGGKTARVAVPGTTVRPVVLCGGSGTRLWPLSRALHPKQLLPLARSETMLQSTVARIKHPIFSAPIVVSGEEHRFLVRDQMAAIAKQPDAIILEPEGRNTAPAIALAAQWVSQQSPDELMLVMPSDHVIADPQAFLSSVEAAVPAALQGALVTFGIEPTKAETGYGYIEAGAELPNAPGVLSVECFVEKPDEPSAREYCKSGRHYWNGGIFLFRPRAFLDQLAEFAPDIATACDKAMSTAMRDGDFVRPAAEPFLSSPAVSIDYAVMEQTKHACIVPVSMGWSDVGSWDALWDISAKDEDLNALHGDVLALDTRGSLLRSEGNFTVAALGVENLIVVATRDAVLVVPRKRAQDAKLIVDGLKAAGKNRCSLHPKVHRPWGTYETTDAGERFQTKRIVVNPGAKLSLQMHHQRSEHWVVVSGTARITIDGQVRLLQENESTFVPAGSLHRLENPGKIPLHLIEVQCGPYLGEDDIVRFEDSYGRLPSVA
ncbi:MAG TPA: mannose-1-phosphate guanylyltransferase/mannose-6-phosphate isomerase [Sphingomicrobium sp.]|nr:mannose-1-phosphate guanylyltransferase/mannose-6-phosphate isomerase [Sphingomicrobium sp.]